MANDKKHERKEEAVAREAVVVKYPDGFLSYKYEPNGNSTPPDYLLDYGTYEIMLEVVLGTDFYINQETLEAESKQLKNPAKELANEVSPLIQLFLKPEETIVLFFDVHVVNIKKTAKIIAEQLKKEYLAGNLKESKTELSILGHPELKIEAILTNYYSKHCEVAPKLYIIPTNNLNSKHLVIESSLSAQAQYILHSNIASKHKKLLATPKEQHDLKKWLAIINTNPILSLDAYIQVFNSIDKREIDYFDKIFIIYNGEAIALRQTQVLEEKNTFKKTSYEYQMEKEIDAIGKELTELYGLLYAFDEWVKQVSADFDIHKQYYTFFNLIHCALYDQIIHAFSRIYDEAEGSLSIVKILKKNINYYNDNESLQEKIILEEIENSVVGNKIKNLQNKLGRVHLDHLISRDIELKEFFDYANFTKKALECLYVRLSLVGYIRPSTNARREIQQLFHKLKSN